MRVERNEIAALRRAAGISRVQLADKCGISYNHLWNVENGYRSPTIRTVTKVARALDCKLDDIYPEIKGGDTE